MQTLSRARFLRGALGLTGAAVGASLLTTKPASAAPVAAPVAADTTRSYASGNFALVIDGAHQGTLKAFGGGDAYGVVTTQAPGTNYFGKKNLSEVKYESIDLEVGLGMGAAVYNLISSTWTGGYPRRTGSIVGADYNGTALSERVFTNALLVATTFPTLDAADKSAAYMTLKLAPESTRDVAPKGLSAPKLLARPWSKAGFRLAIDGLDTTKVSRIGSFTVGQSPVQNDLGADRDYASVPSTIQFPNLSVTFAASSAASWKDWFKDFVIDGNSTDLKERKGTLTLLGSDMATELVRIQLYNVGIYKLGPARLEANADTIARMTAELYCERMEFEHIK